MLAARALALLLLLASWCAGVVSSPTDAVSYTGNGTLATYPVTFTFKNATDLTLTENNAGTITTLGLGVGYTVTGAGLPSGGTITLTGGNLPNAVVLMISRVPALTQLTSLPNGSPYFGSTIEGALDLLCMQGQATQSQAARSLQFPLGDAAATSVLPSTSGRASKYLAFDASGNVIATAGTTSVIPVSTFWSPVIQLSSAGASRTSLGGVSTAVATVSALKALASTDLVGLVAVEGYYSAWDGGGGIFAWNSSDSRSDNGGTILIPNSAPGTGRWNRVAASINSGVYDVRWFGAGLGQTDDTSAIQACLSAGITSAGGGAVVFGPGTYPITAALTIPANVFGFTIEGIGKPIIQQNTTNTSIFHFLNEGPYGFTIKGFVFQWGSNQTSSNTNSIAIAFDASTHTSTGYYEFLIEDVDIVNGWRGIANYPGSGSLPVWGWTIRKVHSYPTMSGGTIVLGSLSGSFGSPRERLEQIYIRRDACTEASLQLSIGVQLDINDVEFNGLSGSGDDVTTLITGVSKVRIQNIRWEGTNQLNSGTELIGFSGSETDATVSDLEVSSHTVSASNCRVVQAFNGARVQLTDTSVGGNAAAPISIGGGDSLFLGAISGSPTSLLRVNGLCKLQSGIPLMNSTTWPSMVFDKEDIRSFYSNALAANTSTQKMVTAGGQTSSEYINTEKGYIMGLSAWLSSSLAAGTITMSVYVNGSLVNSGVALTMGSTSGQSAQIGFYNFAFSTLLLNPGDKVGVRIASTNTQSPTPVDVMCDLLIVHTLDY